MSQQKIIDLTAEQPPKRRKLQAKAKAAPDAAEAAPKTGLKRKLDLKADALLRQMADDARAELERGCDPWPRGKDWPGVPAIGETTGVQFITAADPGEVHMGVWRFQLYPEFKPTHVKIINLHELATLRNKMEPGVQIAHSKILKGGEKRYGTRAVNQALIWYMKREMGAGGLFDSQMLFVESQDFRRDMKGIEMIMLSIFGAARPPVVVHSQPGGARPANQCISANSAKSCYGGMFPSVRGYQAGDEYEDMERNGSVASSSRGRRVHGFGDVKSSASTKLQYESNKRQSKIFGPVVAHVENLRGRMGADLSDADYNTLRQHIAKRKTDDVYDAMFIGLYAINTHLYQMYRYRKKFIRKPLSAVTAPPVRAARQFEEVGELMDWSGASDADRKFAMDALFKK